MEGRKNTLGKRQFACRICGTTAPKWMGRCPGCGQWGVLEEEQVKGWLPGRVESSPASQPLSLFEVGTEVESRRVTGIGELDRVLGGGVVCDSVVLLGGEPGVGKSSLLLQAASSVARQDKVLYVSAEESLSQVKLRADRLKLAGPGLYVLAEANVEIIKEQILSLGPRLVVIDSIQTVYLSELGSTPGSVGQVRESAAEFMRLAKAHGIAFILVGHVTKEGYLSGPKILEHLVDTVIYLEGERFSSLRILRAAKNRFGSTNEIGVFEMGEKGLEEVTNPSALFLTDKHGESSGSVVTAGVEGTRPVLLELQALVTPALFGNPRRLTTGLDLKRVLLLVAVMEKRCGLGLGSQDVYLNLAGGLRLEEPAVDLGICLAVASSLLECSLGPGLVAVGEVGLTGEVRRVGQCEKRVMEAARMGFTRIILPKGVLTGPKRYAIEVCEVQSLLQAFSLSGLLKAGKGV